jgi:hypothetical protein
MRKNNKNKSSIEKSAQHLANLMGVNVAGFKPQYQEDPESEQLLAELLSGKKKVDGFDIEKCLSDDSRSWGNELSLIVIAYILRAESMGSIESFNEIDSNIFIKDKFAHFLFLKIKKLRQENKFTLEQVQDSIQNCGHDVFGYQLSPRLRFSLYWWWFKTLATYPTTQQFKSALAKQIGKMAKMSST